MESLMYFQDSDDQETEHYPFTAPCTACGSSSSTKRASPSSSSSLKRERPFTKIPLPVTSPLPPPPPLRRYNSDPVPIFLNPSQPTEIAPPSALETPSSAARRGISRTISAPESDLIAVTDLIGESPNSKRLKRMKERMKAISKWCDQVITEVDGEDEDDNEVGDDHLIGAEVVNTEFPKEEDCDCDCEGSKSEEEAVSVEKNGDNLIIHMKCPCSKAYQFLLSGNNCYYKLM